MAQEGCVGRAFEQAPHEIGHARHKRPDGRVDAQRMAHVGQRGLQALGHAVQHFECVFGGRKPLALNQGDGQRQAADVVRGDHGVNMHMMPDEHLHASLVVCIRFGLGFPNRHVPSLAARDDRFPVPVGAAHEADADGGAARFRPPDERCQVALRIPEIGLQRDAALRPVCELRFIEDGPEDAEGEPLEINVLHIQRDAAAMAADGPQYRRQPCAYGGNACLRGDGIRLRVE